MRSRSSVVVVGILLAGGAAFADASVKPLVRDHARTTTPSESPSLTREQAARLCAMSLPRNLTRRSLDRAVARALADDAEGQRAWRDLKTDRARSANLSALWNGIAGCALVGALDRPLMVEVVRPKRIEPVRLVMRRLDDDGRAERPVDEEGEEGGVAGGVKGGVAGGVVGGVVGGPDGVVGGVAGGVVGGVASSPPPPSAFPTTVPASRLEPVGPHDLGYPAEARTAGLEGTVMLRITVEPDGSVSETRSLVGPDLLARHAATTVKTWRYKPVLINETPTRVRSLLRLTFRL